MRIIFSPLLLALFLLSFHISNSQSLDLQVDSVLQTLESVENDSIRIVGLMHAWEKVRYTDNAFAKRLMFAGLEIAEKGQLLQSMSLVHYNLGGVYAMEGNDSLARMYYKKSLAYGEVKSDTLIILANWANLIHIEYENGNYAEVIRVGDSLIQIPKINGMKRHSAQIRSLIGLSHYYLGNSLLAMKDFIECADYYEEQGDSSRWADNLNYIGYTQQRLQKYAIARSYYKRAIEIYTLFKDYFFLGQSFSDMGNTFLEEKQLDSAQFYFEKSLVINKRNDFKVLPLSYMSLANLFLQKEAYGKADEYIKNAIPLFEKYNETKNVIEAYAIQAEVFRKRGNLGKAYQVLQKAESLSASNPNPENEQNIFQSMAKVSASLGKWEESATYWQKYAAVKDTIFQKETVRQQNELWTVYDTEKKEKALLLEQKENEILRQEAQISALQVRWISVVSILVIGIIGMFFALYRQRAKRKQLIQEEEKKSLEQKLEFKKRELTSQTLHLVSKNKLLTNIKSAIEKIKEASENKTPFSVLIGSIDNDLRGDSDWKNFEMYFKEVYSDFDKKIKQAFSELKGSEVKLITLMKMNLSTKEIATILNITPESVNKARYRLRKKLNLDRSQNLQQYILAL